MSDGKRTLTAKQAELAEYLVGWVLGDEPTKRTDESELRLLLAALRRRSR